MNSLFILLHTDRVDDIDELDAETLQCDWVVLGEENDLMGQGTTNFSSLLAQVEEIAESETISNSVLLLPDTVTVFIRADIPGKTSSQMIKALPYAVESYVSTDIEKMHLARGTVRKGNPVACLAIEKTHLGLIVEQLIESGVEPSYCSTIGMQIPVDEGSVGVLADDQGVWIRTSEQLAVMDLESAVDALTFLAQPSDELDTKIHIKNFSQSRELAHTIGRSPFVEIEDVADPLLVHVAQQFDDEQGINLLQDEFSARDSQVLDTKSWVRNGIIGMTALLVYIAIVLGQGVYAGIQAQNYDDDAKELFESIYGQSSGTRNHVASMRVNMGQASRQSSPLETLLDEFASAVSGTRSRIVINNLVYRESQQALTTEMELSSWDALDNLEKTLESGSVDAEVTNTESVGFGTRASLTMELKQ